MPIEYEAETPPPADFIGQWTRAQHDTMAQAELPRADPVLDWTTAHTEVPQAFPDQRTVQYGTMAHRILSTAVPNQETLQNGTIAQVNSAQTFPAERTTLQLGTMAQPVVPTIVPDRAKQLQFGISCDQQQHPSTSYACFAGNQDDIVWLRRVGELSNNQLVPLRSNKTSTSKAKRKQTTSNSCHAPPTAQHPHPQQKEQVPKCSLCCGTNQVTNKELFNREPVCHCCYMYAYHREKRIEQILKKGCAPFPKCPNKYKLVAELHEMCRENQTNRAGFLSIAKKCEHCAVRLCMRFGLSFDKKTTYAPRQEPPAPKRKRTTIDQVEELESPSNRAIVQQMAALSHLRSIAILQVNCGADITQMMAVNFVLKPFIEMSANRFMEAFNEQGIAVKYLVNEGVFTKRPELSEPNIWYIFSCNIVQLDNEHVEAYLQMPLKGCKLNQQNEPIRRKVCQNENELADHLVDLERKHLTPYFNGAFQLRDISVNNLLEVLKYLDRWKTVPYEKEYDMGFADDALGNDQIAATKDGYVTPRAASLVLYNVECRQIGSMDCTYIWQQLFNGFSCPLVVIENWDRIQEFDFRIIQQCKQFTSANVVVLRKNHRDANARNDPKIDADAYVEYVNTPSRTFSSFVWAPQLSKMWERKSKSAKNSYRELKLKYTVLEYLPTFSADEEVCNLLANLVLTEPFLEDLFLGPGRIHFIDIEMLIGLDKQIMPGLTSIFAVLVDKIEQAFLHCSKDLVPYTLFVAGPKLHPMPNAFHKPNNNGELFAVRLFELELSGRLLMIVQRFLPDLSQPSTSSSAPSSAAC